jgi:hypothetical protein
VGHEPKEARTRAPCDGASHSEFRVVRKQVERRLIDAERDFRSDLSVRILDHLDEHGLRRSARDPDANAIVVVPAEFYETGRIQALGNTDSHFSMRIAREALKKTLRKTFGDHRPDRLVGIAHQSGQSKPTRVARCDGADLEVRVSQPFIGDLRVPAKEAVDAKSVSIAHTRVRQEAAHARVPRPDVTLVAVEAHPLPVYGCGPAVLVVRRLRLRRPVDWVPLGRGHRTA